MRSNSSVQLVPFTLAVVTIIALAVLSRWRYRLVKKRLSERIPGCHRLGLQGPSNLNRQEDARVDHASMNEKRGVTKATVKALFTYPVKSCRGIELQSSDVVETGLRYDRIFSFAQLLSEADKSGAKKVVNSVTTPTDKWVHSWKFITQRQHPRLALLETELRVPNDVRAPPDSSSELVQSGGCLIVRFPFLPDFNPFGIFTEHITIKLPLSPTNARAKAKNYSHETIEILERCARSCEHHKRDRACDTGQAQVFPRRQQPTGLVPH